MIQAALVNYLKTNLSISRIFPIYAPQGADLPVVTIDLSSSTRSRHFEGGDVGTGLIDTDFEVSVWASTLIESTQLIDELISLLETFRGTMTDPSSPNVNHIVADISIDGSTQDFNGSTELYDHSIFINVVHS